MSKQSPFLGVYRRGSGELVDMLTGEVVTADQIKPRMTPFYGVFLDKDGNEHDIEELGGGGGGGTTNYNALTNRPQINGVTLQGNQTAAQLGLASLEQIQTEIAAQTYTHNQNTASAVWNIPHFLGKQYVDVLIIDSAGNPCTADIEYTNANVVVITFSIPVAGTAIIRR